VAKDTLADCQIMSITIKLDLPEALVAEAQKNGLLASAPIGDLLAVELRRRQAAARLEETLNRIRAQPGEPVSEQEIAATIKEARRKRRGQ
jgi:hypothetical protein